MESNWRNVFVTVGSTQFDALIQAVTSQQLLDFLSTKGCVNLTIQYGSSDIKPTLTSIRHKININCFDYKDSLLDDIRSADLVIGHAGAGTALEVLRNGKTMLMVVNDELMDNHQTELAHRLQTDGYLFYCDLNSIRQSLANMNVSLLKPFPKQNNTLFAHFLDNLLDFNNDRHHKD